MEDSIRGSPYKLRIHRWTENNLASYASVALAQRIAASADMVFECMQLVRDGTLDRNFPACPDPETVERLYGDHRAVTRAVFDQFPNLFGDGEDVQRLLDESRRMSVSARRDPRQAGERFVNEAGGLARFVRLLQVGTRLAARNYKRHLIELRRELCDGNSDDVLEGDLEEKLRRSPELYFFIRVMLVSITAFQTIPAVLLRRASRGDVEAIERLVRIDPRAIHLSAIERWENAENGETRRARMEQLHRWREQGLNHGQFSRRSVKVMLGGLISALFLAMGSYWCFERRRLLKASVTAPGIRDLFNAVAQDRAGRAMGVYDDDLAEMQAESWSKMIGRSRVAWQRMLPMLDGQKSSWVLSGGDMS